MDTDTHKEAIYQIKISGRVHKRWDEWFHHMQITTEINKDGNPITVFTGPVIDQVALRGLMNKMWDLNMEVISVQRKDIWAADIGGTPDETDY